MLEEARARLQRVTPREAHAAMAAGARLVDIRSESQRARDGTVPEAHFVPRNVLEWRLDPASPHRDPDLTAPGIRVVLMCDAGYQSSLAAATAKDLGLDRVTDLVGGFQAWRAEGLPVDGPD
jgi:rhodanese-related sulfurtransferase